MQKLTTVDTPMLYNIIQGILSPEQEDKNGKPANKPGPPPKKKICKEKTTGIATAKTTDNATKKTPASATKKTPDNTSNKTTEKETQDIVAPADETSNQDFVEAGLAEYSGFEYLPPDTSPQGKELQHSHIASVICSMVKFTLNRRYNGLQLKNCIRFYACGVSETVNEYLHYMGLTSHRKTAIEALKSLSSEAMDWVENSMALSNSLAPILCIDNLDMEERIQIASVGKQTRTFHGTWGYLHIPDDDLLKSLNPDKLTLDTFHHALRNVASLDINPQMFLPTSSPADDYTHVWKSQIAQVMHKYVATPSDKRSMLPLNPPSIEPISPKNPNIQMLRLMDESNNSAEGIGQVMEALQRQSGLEPKEFFGRLQLMDANLGTCQIFNAIRMLRIPSEHCEHSLNNISMSLGAAHTLWNIAHTILTHHFGNSNAMDDLGVWHYLEALGIPPEKVIQKKDFTKMLNYMEQVHEATIWYCLREVMGKHDEVINEELSVIPTAKWNEVVEQCYLRFCTHDARRRAKSSPQLFNLLNRMRDFSTVIEARRSMKAGDVGRLINIWKMWSYTLLGISPQTHIASHSDFASLNGQIDSANLTGITSRTGRPLCCQGFPSRISQLFIYTCGGAGTQIEQLKTLISSNIPLLKSMFDSLRIDSGAKHIQQSHKIVLTLCALETFNQMATSKDILNSNPVEILTCKVKLQVDTYLDGLKILQAELKNNESELHRFTMHLPFDEQVPEPESELDDDDVNMEDNCSIGTDSPNADLHNANDPPATLSK
ncbi:hypothetical protein PTTG_29762 [Puccinia triticina 1-1 BBBD Race 1]|uniref:DUF6589 domain-containing protein n=1 Tax=Puccinia triticina (isolate 1-1 / race 1 (BBBD)) TaxID=630390 RepID=A0A180G219_PUCT1|nr:hypothetical protein PTTG_29762 [Puccinia triticina 1-1 BBBD Race 1]